MGKIPHGHPYLVIMNHYRPTGVLGICLGLLLIIACQTGGSEQTPASDAAEIPISKSRIERFDSSLSFMRVPRTFEVWLPPGYDESGVDYPVLYMHDGRMLFDSTTTWNKQEWGVDETMEQGIAEGTIPPTIVVGIWNGGPDRHAEYFPQKPFESLEDSLKQFLLTKAKRYGGPLFTGSIRSDDYLAFLVHDVKPFIDSTYRTRPDRESTYVMGSSMGGLISMYALCEYPEVFGGAACMSTHWIGSFQPQDNPIPDSFLEYMDAHLPAPGDQRIWFDHGTLTLDSIYAPYQERVDRLLENKGWLPDYARSTVYPGTDHSERAWQARLPKVLEYLLPPFDEAP
jgi:enterochelin esterase-like enzyme